MIPKKMHAVTFERYGGPEVLKYVEVMTPNVEPDQVLVRVCASSLTRGDWHYIHGKPFPLRFMAGGLIRPKRNRPGGDIAGVVQEVGRSVDQFKPGDEVFGEITQLGFGGWSDFVAVKATALLRKPEHLSFEEAACLPISGSTAFLAVVGYGLVRSGNRVMIHGASGGVGHLATFLAESMGADVVAVCRKAKGEKLSKFTNVTFMDPDTTDPLKSEETFDVVIDTAGYRSPWDFARVISQGGRYILVGGSIRNLINVMSFGKLMSMKTGVEFRTFLQEPDTSLLDEVVQFCKQKNVRPLVIDSLPFSEASRAMELLEQRNLCGKVILRPETQYIGTLPG